MVVSGEASEWRMVTSGIPQGSVLGPVLFVIYINDLPNTVDSDCYLFADDTKIFAEIENLEDSGKLQTDLTKLEEWSDKWLLKFHPDKCVVMTVGQRKVNTEYSMSSGSGRC